jgi:PTH2 family peptidyl-tRNA hydrolase
MKQVIIVRSDLNMRRGKEAAQAAHASLTAVLAYSDSPLVRRWLRDFGGCKIVVSVASEGELIAAYNAARDAGMICALIQDAGRTEFAGVHTFTAVAIGPGHSKDVDAFTGGMKLR